MVDQVAVGGVNLDAVKARCLGILRGTPVVGDDARQFGEFQRAWRHHILLALAGEHPAFGGDSRRGDRQRAAFLQCRVRDATDVPELDDDLAALGVHGVGYQLPAGDLFGAVDARCLDVALTLRRDLRSFTDDQTGTGALCIVGHR